MGIANERARHPCHLEAHIVWRRGAVVPQRPAQIRCTEQLADLASLESRLSFFRRGASVESCILGTTGN